MPKEEIKNQYTFNVKPEYFKPPRHIDFLQQIAPVLNITELARKTPVRHPNTFKMRMQRGTVLGNNPDHEEFAEITGEILNEMFWVLGVGLGHFPNDPHKFLKHFPPVRKKK